MKNRLLRQAWVMIGVLLAGMGCIVGWFWMLGNYGGPEGMELVYQMVLFFAGTLLITCSAYNFYRICRILERHP